MELVRQAVEGLCNKTMQREVVGLMDIAQSPSWEEVKKQIVNARNRERRCVEMRISTAVCSGLQLTGIKESYMKLHAGNMVNPAVSALSTPNPWTGGEKSEVKCYNCNKTGHIATPVQNPRKRWHAGDVGPQVME